MITLANGIIMPDRYSLREIASVTGGELSGNAEGIEIHHLCFDSRSIDYPFSTLFFAIKTARHDGHKYIAETYEKGVRAFVISDKKVFENLSTEIRNGAAFILVGNTVDALQALAAHHRQKFHIPMIGITGSNGKTVVKEWLFQLLQPDFKIVRSPKSFNSQIGVPLSVWQLDESHTLGIFEAGISLPDEMEKLAEIIRPDTGIFTNLTDAHQAGFSSQKEKALEKLMLFAGAKKLVYRSDYEVLRSAIDETFRGNDVELVSWSFGGDQYAKYRVNSISKSELQIETVSGKNTLAIPFTDNASVENILQCYMWMREMGYGHEIIQERVKSLHPVEMRLELKEGINGCTIINDSYNSDIQSLSIALDTLNQQNQHATKTLILSDILESGADEKTLYGDVAALIRQKGTSKFIGIGPALIRNKDLFQAGSRFYPGTDEFLSEYEVESFINEAILLKGSRVFQFEKIARRLQRKAHTTELHINLSALVHNLNFYRSLLKPETKIIAMVKAFSYGSGSFEIANVLQHHKVDYLAVAYADEGVFLRRHGVTLPIIVMNPEANAFEAFVRHRLEPEVYSLKLFDELTRFLKSGGHPPLPIHVKLETGMHRLGFMPDEIEPLVAGLKDNKTVYVASIFSHLASADIRGHDSFTEEQIRLFEQGSGKIIEELAYPIPRHILNSSGIVRFPQAQYDMVRLGLGLYGLDPAEEVSGKLETVSTLKTHISQIKAVKKGDSVGYSRKGILNRDSRIAVLGIGYADGLPRAYGNGRGEVMINGQRALLVGNICMDMCMADVTDINAEEGDEAIVFGKEPKIEEVAARLDTIPYEVLTNVSQRVKRVYFKE